MPVKLGLLGMSSVEYWELSSILANIASAIFAKTDNSQHLMQLIPKNRGLTLNASCKNLKIKNCACWYISLHELQVLHNIIWIHFLYRSNIQKQCKSVQTLLSN
jgi:hypothetical protein